jgi:hypothetical protein
MSLDVHLITKEPTIKKGTGVYIREDGKNRELSRDEVLERFPNVKAVPIQKYESDQIYSDNITHNLGKMADAAGIYSALWRPDEMDWTHAHDIIPELESGLKELKADPERFKKFNPENGWGNYENLVEFVEKYLNACRENPSAEIEVSR